jgi:hypothetical protein
LVEMSFNGHAMFTPSIRKCSTISLKWKGCDAHQNPDTYSISCPEWELCIIASHDLFYTLGLGCLGNKSQRSLILITDA